MFHNIHILSNEPNDGDILKYDYENQVLCFYDWLETNQVGTSCIVLWHALMHTYRKAGYPDLFGVAISILEIKTGLKRATIKRARNELRQMGRLEWFERKGNQSALYKIIHFGFVAHGEPQPEPQIEPIICKDNNILNKNSKSVAVNSFVAHDEPQYEPQPEPQCDPQCEPQPVPIIYNNNNILNKDNKDVVVDPFVAHGEPQPEPQTNIGFKNVHKYCEQRFGYLLSPTAFIEIQEFLSSGVEEGLICKAIDKSIDAGARNWNYAKKVVDGCIIKGVLTLQQYIASEANRATSMSRIIRNGGVKANGSDPRNNQQRARQQTDQYSSIGAVEL